MAKNKGSNKTAKNVFKVAVSRTHRLKSKAQKVTLNLKNLGKSKNPNKEKTNLINQQLAELRKEVYQAKDAKKSELAGKKKGKKLFQTKKKSTKMETESTASLVKNMQI